MSTRQLDVATLHRLLVLKVLASGMSWRSLGRELDLAASVFSRMKQGLRPDADALVTLVDWLGIELSTVTKAKEPPQ